jgi:hypothetical protein
LIDKPRSKQAQVIVYYLLMDILAIITTPF